MLSIKADFDFRTVHAEIQSEMDAWFDELLETFREQGREFTKRARAKTKAEGGFGNITWNLRSSIGYCLVYQNKVIETYFPPIKGGTVGEDRGEELAERLALYGDYGDGIVLVMVAGMEYAAFVKAKGIDVIQSSSAHFESQVKLLLAA